MIIPSRVMPPLMFGGLIVFMLIGYPVAFSLAAVGLVFGFIGIQTGYFTIAFLQALPDRRLRHHLQRPPARHPVLHLHGRDPRALRPGRGSARGHRPAVRPGARRPRLRRDPGRRDPRRDHRHGRRIGHRHGRDLAAGHDALRLRHEARHRRASPPRAPSRSSSRRRWCSSCWPTSSAARSATCISARSGPSILQVLLFWPTCWAVAGSSRHRCRRCRRRRASNCGWRCWSRCLRGMVPSLVLIFLVLGTIFLGLATPTEAGAMGAVGAIALAAINRRLTWPLVRQAMATTMRITSMVVFILIGSTVFTLVFRGVDGDLWIEHLLTLAARRRRSASWSSSTSSCSCSPSSSISSRSPSSSSRCSRRSPSKLGIDLDLVRRAAVREHADLVHASAVRLRAVLSARHRAARR